MIRIRSVRALPIAPVNLFANIILAPYKANPNFNYSNVSGIIYKKNSIEKHPLLMNTGNYVLNSYLIQNLNLQHETENIQKSSACDVIYFNTLLFEQLDLHMHVVENLEYEHVVHNGSIYLQTHTIFKNFNKEVHSRYYNLK